MTDKRIKMDCPFCHTPAEKIQLKHYGTMKSIIKFWYVICPECGVQTATYTNRLEAESAWNRR